MLAYILALTVGLGSIAIYMAAFFFPEVHRKNDFYWSGVGFFYALVLWVCAGRITGGLLLGQLASVALLGWFAWQTLTLRRELLPVEQQTAVPSKEELQEKLSKLTPPGGLGKLQEQVTGLFATAKNQVQRTVISVTQRPKAKTDTDKPPQSLKNANATTDTTVVEVNAIPETPELVPPHPPSPELVEAAQASTPEDSPTISVPIEEIAPDAVLAPPAEAPVPEEMPPNLSDASEKVTAVID